MRGPAPPCLHIAARAQHRMRVQAFTLQLGGPLAPSSLESRILDYVSSLEERGTQDKPFRLPFQIQHRGQYAGTKSSHCGSSLDLSLPVKP